MKNIISTKKLLEQKEERRLELERLAAMEQQKAILEQQKIEEHKDAQKKKRRDKIREGLRLSYVAYSSPRVTEAYLENHGFTHIIHLSGWTGAQGFCCIRDRKACLVFRGTSSPSDFLIDLALFPFYRPATHFGFNFSWRNIRKDVFHWLAEFEESFDSVAIFGHSLGGAMAHIAALDIVYKQNVECEIEEVVTFGAPRSSFLSTGELYNNFQQKRSQNKTLGSVTTRVVNKLDIVSKVPYRWMGYRHVGELVYLSTNGKVYYDKEAGQIQDDERFLSPVFNLFEHEISVQNNSELFPLHKDRTPASAQFEANETKGSRIKKMIDFYNRIKHYHILIKIVPEILFYSIAPFIFLFGTILYLLRSGGSHLKNEYTRYFFESSDQLEKELESIMEQLKISKPSLLITMTIEALKMIAKLAFIGGLLYVCYLIFIKWSWPIIIDLFS